MVLSAAGLVSAAHAGAGALPGALVSVSDSRTPAADFGGDARLEARTQRIDWRGEARRLGDLAVSVGFSYDYTRFEYSGLPSRDRDLHRFQFPVLLDAEQGAWQWRLTLAPGVATSSNVAKDMVSRGTSDDVFVTGAIEATRPAGAMTLSAGVASDRRFGRSRAYPRVALRGGGDVVSWQLGAPDAWLDLRAGADMQWHVVRDYFGSDFDYRQRRWDIRVFWRRRFGERLALSLHAGRAFDRRHRFEADVVAPIAGDAADAWSFGVRLGYGDVTRAAGYAEAW